MAPRQWILLVVVGIVLLGYFVGPKVVDDPTRGAFYTTGAGIGRVLIWSVPVAIVLALVWLVWHFVLAPVWRFYRER